MSKVVGVVQLKYSENVQHSEGPKANTDINVEKW